MPLEEYLTENDIKSCIPELSRFLWIEETDFTPQKQKAIEEVTLELSARGFNPAEIMPRLYIRYAGTAETADHITESTGEDLAARLRYVLSIKVFTAGGLKTFNLEGSNDRSNWETIDSRKAESAGIVTFIIPRSFLYYRLNVSITGGAIDYEAFLCDTSVEKLVSYKWLELILLDRFTAENDQYHLKMKYFRKEYENLLGKIRIWMDKDSDGSLALNEFSKTTTIKILK
ncbi:MAG TPA: hypothetical protein VG961_03220 [Ignavibacteria bacterium]|nr:hypothetical protein [Ignavibacteria bacterium]